MTIFLVFADYTSTRGEDIVTNCTKVNHIMLMHINISLQIVFVMYGILYRVQ